MGNARGVCSSALLCKSLFAFKPSWFLVSSKTPLRDLPQAILCIFRMQLQVMGITWAYKLLLCSVPTALEGVWTLSVKMWCSGSSCTSEKLERKKNPRVLKQKKEGRVNQQNNLPWARDSVAFCCQGELPEMPCSLGVELRNVHLSLLSSNTESKGEQQKQTSSDCSCKEGIFYFEFRSQSVKRNQWSPLIQFTILLAFTYLWIISWWLLSKEVQLRIQWGVRSQHVVYYNLQPVVLRINPASFQTHILHQYIISIGLHMTLTLSYSKEERERSLKIRGIVPDNLSHVIGACSCLHACTKELKEREQNCKTGKLHVEMSCIGEWELQPYYYFR